MKSAKRLFRYSLFGALTVLIAAGCQTPAANEDSEAALPGRPPSQEFPQRLEGPSSSGQSSGSSQDSRRGSGRSAVNLQNQSGASANYNNDLYRISKQMVQSGVVGEAYQYRINITALESLGEIEVREYLPDGVEFVESSVNPASTDGPIVWQRQRLSEGQTWSILVNLRPTAEGQYDICSVVEAYPMICLPISAGIPNLSLTKTGPARARLGEEITWNVVVTNTGSATAQNVVVEDQIPAGFETIGETRRELGNLEPNQSQNLEFRARATQAGEFTNTVVANADNTEPAQGQAPVAVVQASVDVQKTGPERGFIFAPETYTITVTNTGDIALENVVVEDRLPEFGQLAESGGGRVSGNTVTWRIATLQPGESRDFNVRMSAASPGTTENCVAVRTDVGVTAEDCVSTRWVAVPGVQIEVIDDEDPVRIGSVVTYTAKIKNQGKFEPVTARIRVILSEQLRPTGTAGPIDGEIRGNAVVFQQLTLEPGKDVVLTITADAVSAGSAGARLEFNAGFAAEPYISEEPTTVY